MPTTKKNADSSGTDVKDLSPVKDAKGGGGHKKQGGGHAHAEGGRRGGKHDDGHANPGDTLL